MPLSEDNLSEVRSRVLLMFMDTIETFKFIEQHADTMYGPRAPAVRAAIKEYLHDFLGDGKKSGEENPEALIYKTPRGKFQRAGLYGAQLALKERQVSSANATLRERMAKGLRKFWDKPFKKWVDIINNFLGSLASATGVGEALKELKDCLRDELPDDTD